MKPIIISIASIKGGVAKTTTSHALACYLSKDHKVLLWDNDPQRSLTLATVDTSEIQHTAYDVIQNKIDPTVAAVKALPTYKNIDVIPASNQLAGLEAATSTNIDRMFLFQDAVAGLSSYDFLIFDCPSSIGLLTSGPLVASDYAISPVACAPAAFETLSSLQETIAIIQRRLNPRLKWFILPTLFDQRQVLDRDVLAEIQKQYGDLVLGPPIRKRISLAEDMAAQRPCSNEDYQEFTHNFLERIHHEKQQEVCTEKPFF
jgi:chromosome partitioning protein